MNKNPDSQNSHRPYNRYGAALVLISIAVVTLLFSNYGHGQASPQASSQASPQASSSEIETVFIPLATSSSRSGPPPAYVSGIMLEGAQCPNDIAINKTSGNIYITNEYSDNISLLRETDFVGNIATGTWPIWVESDPYSDTVYVSNVVSGVTVLDAAAIKNQIAPYHESYNITINAVNGYTYVNDLHRPITIIQGEERITNLFVPDFEGHRIEWQLASGFDEHSGLTYFASWQKGAMTVVDGLQVVEQFPYYGEGAKDMFIDSYRRLMYIANYRAGEDGQWLNNISIVDIDTKAVTAIYTAQRSRHIAMDQTTGYVYVTNPADDTVTVLRGSKVTATYQTGKGPWGVAVDPTTGYAYVANSGEASVSVFHDGEPVTKIELPTDKGFQPWQIAVDPQSHRVYVINRSSEESRGENARGSIICEQPWVHVLH